MDLGQDDEQASTSVQTTIRVLDLQSMPAQA